MSHITDNRTAATSEFTRRFGAGNAPAQGQAAQQSNQKPQKEATKYWINVGYPITVQDDQGNNREEFVSLRLGIPLDSIEYLPANSSNADWRKREAAQNHLLDLLRNKAAGLEGGESVILDKLSVELRMVKDKAVAESAEDNGYVGNFSL
ncbi:ssDNA-binding protein [Stenotrophomonas phage C121]|uniref:ssDNA-binding protein n=1 Tax=Stenotrophomonas phage C121 TaxID=2914029 RepID=UPI0023291480|nr:ssDNA-binding protein [Stenotrophomonas phage C121]UKL14746.1 ssDNA-binding protein [Stenotrophomonas phage C121]